MASERVFLTYEQAEALLPAGDEVHVFLNQAPNIIVGADWSRDEVLGLLRGYRSELSGAMATRMGHGIGLIRGNERVFIATDEQALARLKETLKVPVELTE